jgi:oligopeptide/dipeptide ABC transporter ATP-binding protein
MSEPVLEVRDLSVSVGDTPIVRDVSFTVAKGERMGLVGESGSGKTLTVLAVMGLLRAPLRVSGGEALLGGVDLLKLKRRQLDRIRGGRIGMIYQDPMASLNPLHRVGDQIAEGVRLHTGLDRAAAGQRTIELLDEVGIHDAAARVRSYPHELSGGMRQRVMIAMALGADPEVLLCDEPTTALDVTTQRRIVELLLRVSEQRGLGLVMITHDLGVAAGFCDEIAVMYAGRIVERAPVDELYARPRHPYAESLLGAACDLTLDLEAPIPAIPGRPPTPGELPRGCSFNPRCRYAQDTCRVAEPPLEPQGLGAVACYFELGSHRVAEHVPIGEGADD